MIGHLKSKLITYLRIRTLDRQISEARILRDNLNAELNVVSRKGDPQQTQLAIAEWDLARDRVYVHESTRLIVEAERHGVPTSWLTDKSNWSNGGDGLPFLTPKASERLQTNIDDRVRFKREGTRLQIELLAMLASLTAAATGIAVVLIRA